jgi:phage gp36-like protein
MSYAVIQDMIDRYGEAELVQLTDRAVPPTGAYDADVVEAALNDAEAEINAYLSVRYALPLTNVPTTLKKLACDIARYNLFGPNLTDEVSLRYKNAISFLKDVSRGTADLGIDQATGEAPEAESGPDYSADDRIFTKDTLSDYCD